MLEFSCLLAVVMKRWSVLVCVGEGCQLGHHHGIELRLHREMPVPCVR